MLSVTESMLAYQNRNNVEQADMNTAYLEGVIARLQATINSQAATIAAQKKQTVVDQCTITGYRAYVEYMRSVCDDDTLIDAADSYVESFNQKAEEMKVPHLKQKKNRQ